MLLIVLLCFCLSLKVLNSQTVEVTSVNCRNYNAFLQCCGNPLELFSSLFSLLGAVTCTVMRTKVYFIFSSDLKKIQKRPLRIAALNHVRHVFLPEMWFGPKLETSPGSFWKTAG